MEQVTEVRLLRGSYVRISLQNGIKYYLLRKVYQERPVQTGDNIDEKEFAWWVLKHQYRPALNQAVSMLAQRACSKGEIQRKLSLKGYSKETIEMVLLKLEKTGCLDDQDFAKQWTEHRSAQKYGPRRISQELKNKGIPAEEADAVMQCYSEERMLDNALQLARKGIKNRKEKDDLRRSCQKIMTGIVRRGYSWEVAKQALNRALKESDTESDE